MLSGEIPSPIDIPAAALWPLPAAQPVCAEPVLTAKWRCGHRGLPLCLDDHREEPDGCHRYAGEAETRRRHRRVQSSNARLITRRRHRTLRSLCTTASRISIWGSKAARTSGTDRITSRPNYKAGSGSKVSTCSTLVSRSLRPSRCGRADRPLNQHRDNGDRERCGPQARRRPRRV
jgi:hypothetical protein